jgi:parallel beta-helix repeat protein
LRLGILLALVVLPAQALGNSEPIPIEHDNLMLEESVRIAPGAYAIVDADRDGVVHVFGDDITVDFQGAHLHGAEPDRPANMYKGIGILVTGKRVTLRGARVSGFKIGIYAREADGLAVENCDVSGNYRHQLKSTPKREDLQDWLSPHYNDEHQWRDNYGAGLLVEQAGNVTVRRVRARQGQNGIVLDRVTDSKIYDNDCSFLSGWGLALWRSSRNLISRNAFDFCIRGYSHGVYNRGQDSAGMLLFEQNNENVIVENSATHGGDGLFGFGGVASMAGGGRTGNNNNLIAANDFSYAAAHGIEMTFSFGNHMVRNNLVENAICGIWGGYSQDTVIAGNRFERNGQAGYGAERGGVNIEHGSANAILGNQFAGNACGVYLWSDEDAHLAREPWIKANHRGSADNVIAGNRFDGDAVGIHLRKSSGTRLGDNAMKDVAVEWDTDEPPPATQPAGLQAAPKLESYPVEGETRPIGARQQLAGRQNIVMTEWGPYDFEGYAISPQQVVAADRAYVRLLGPKGEFKVARQEGDIHVEPIAGTLPAVVTISAKQAGLTRFAVEFEADSHKLATSGTLLRGDWKVRHFSWNRSDDPREVPERWQLKVNGPPLFTSTVPALDFTWGHGAPAEQVPPDYFGTVAETTLELPEGTWRIRTVSDDGIRVWVDGSEVISNWTQHVPTEDSATIPLAPGPHTFRVEHFEIDGYATLQLTMTPLD